MNNGQVVLVQLCNRFFFICIMHVKMVSQVWAHKVLQIRTRFFLRQKPMTHQNQQNSVLWHHPHWKVCVHRKWRWKLFFSPPLSMALIVEVIWLRFLVSIRLERHFPRKPPYCSITVWTLLCDCQHLQMRETEGYDVADTTYPNPVNLKWPYTTSTLKK